jgi:hypothetical protein
MCKDRLNNWKMQVGYYKCWMDMRWSNIIYCINISLKDKTNIMLMLVLHSLDKLDYTVGIEYHHDIG